MKLWKHQEEMIAFALTKKNSLWHCGMGTGKTRAAIEVIGAINPALTLITCPLAVVSVWQKQLCQFAQFSYTAAFLLKGSVKQKMEKAEETLRLAAVRNEPFIVVINYESAWRPPFNTWALTKRWDIIIADECHALKAPGGKASRYFARLRHTAKKILGLSGTPIPHSPLDAYGLYRFLDPSVFGKNYHLFKTTYAVYGGYENRQVIAWRNQEDFAAKFNSIRIHVTRDVLDLPPAIHNHIEIELPPAVMKTYRSLEKDFYAAVDAGEITVNNALTKLLRLQQITSGHIITDDGETNFLHNEKGRHLQEILEGIEADEPIVILCRFRNDLKICHDVAAKLGRHSVELSGNRKELDQWKDILVAQIRTAREGIDLTYARYCFYFSLGFSLSEYEQSLAREHRPGQTRTVFYYHLIAKSTIDAKIYKALKSRADVINSILEDRSSY